MCSVQTARYSEYQSIIGFLGLLMLLSFVGAHKNQTYLNLVKTQSVETFFFSLLLEQYLILEHSRDRLIKAHCTFYNQYRGNHGPRQIFNIYPLIEQYEFQDPERSNA
ncbi:hypothetical protein F4811DRAFT_548226 [Daldinia bambusicola]|nr:hypothetical protein F4811DRAFT_548226 [Daldinia bambusicola]